MTGGSVPPVLLERREHDCRLASDRWLTTLDEARSFLDDRGVLSITPSCWLPSLFGACPPNPDPGAGGFAAMPVHRWWWPGALSELPGVRRTKLLRGKVLLMEDDLFRAIAPLCVLELARAEQGAYGTDGQQLVAYLDQQGPSLLGQARDALGFPSRSMARVRQQLEAVGAVISEDIQLPAANGGHVRTSRLSRVDQCPPLLVDSTADLPVARRRLIAAAVRAAVVAPRDDVERWFTWPNVILTAPVPLAVGGISALLLRSLIRRQDSQPFFLSLGLFALSYAGLGISMYPYIVPQSITIWQAASPQNSQIFMLVGVAVLVPLILGYTAWAYWVFRGKVKAGAGYH